MDATALLRKDHDEVRLLFKAFENTGDDVRAKAELFRQIREQLHVHSRIEEEIFYPAVRDLRSGPGTKDEGPELIQEATEEHQEVDELLAEIASIDPERRAFTRKVRKLRRAVEHHATEEEQEMFPFAHRHLGDERLAALGAQLEARKKDLAPRDPHAPVPAATPRSPTA